MILEVRVHSKVDQSEKPYKLNFERRLILGRGPECPIVFDGSNLSREHFAFIRESAGLRVTDLSSNGTWLNGKRLQKGISEEITAGHVVEIPGYRIEIVSADGVEPAAAGTTAVMTPVPPKAAPASVPAAAPPPPPPPKSLTDQIFGPVRAFWRGFTGLERTMIWVALFAFGLWAIYVKSN